VAAADEWGQIVEPWRAVAQRHGFRPIERKVELIAGGHRCLEHLASGATWLDLYGELGQTHGFWSATLTTWIDAGGSRFSLSTAGEASPRPRPRGAAGWIAGRLLAPLMHKLAPPDVRPMPLRAPEDLAALIAKHTAELMAVAGRPVQFATLADRFAQERMSARP
jgi:hypothetical protein